jgi:hypothetical protein
MEMKDTENYIPGVCNIGKEERKRRRQAGIIGLILTVLAYSLFVYFDVNKGVRFLVFFPAMLSAVGFIQSRMHFCVYFGLSEIFNFDNVGKFSKVGTEEYVRKDKKEARLIIYYSVLIGIAVGLLAALV